MSAKIIIASVIFGILQICSIYKTMVTSPESGSQEKVIYMFLGLINFTLAFAVLTSLAKNGL